MNPLRLMLGLADAVESWGVRIYENTKVVKLEKKERPPRQREEKVVEEENEEGGEGGGRGAVRGRDRGRYAVITDAGRAVRCDHVVLCTGAAAMPADVSRRLSRSFLPFYTYSCPVRDGAVEDELPMDGGTSGDDERRRARPAPQTYADDQFILNYWRSGGGPSPKRRRVVVARALRLARGRIPPTLVARVDEAAQRPVGGIPPAAGRSLRSGLGREAGLLAELAAAHQTGR